MIIALFFTFGISLQQWKEKGLLSREMTLYERLLAEGRIEKFYWFTYGIEDIALSKYLPAGIKIISPPKIFKGRILLLLYSLLIPFIQKKHLSRTDIIKTNQMKGGWAALLAAKLFRKKLVLRGGYIWSKLTKRTKNILYYFCVLGMEKIMCELSSLIIVATTEQRKYLINKHSLLPNKIEIVPNYVDTELFKPNHNILKKRRFVFVGRVHKEKNLKNAILALKEIGIDIYGEGPERTYLEDFAYKHNLDARFKGKVSNQELPYILNQYQYFILPSLYEGMPKALIEAMSCGLVVFGTNVEGINSIIKNKKNGILIGGVMEKNIRKSLLEMEGNNIDKELLAKNARQYVEEKFSLETVYKREYSLLECLNKR